MKTIISLKDVQVQFPDAYGDLTSGDWEDNDTGEPITSFVQLERWLENDTFYVNMGVLEWDCAYEGLRYWDSTIQTWMFWDGS